MVKCLDCENLLQLFMCPCEGKIREPEDFKDALEFLNTFDFCCDCNYDKILSKTDIKTERDCEDFTPIEESEED